jgi:hypothetical protein
MVYCSLECLNQLHLRDCAGILFTKHQLVKLQAAKGDLSAQMHLGLQFLDGSGVPEDAEQALLWLKRSAEGGYVIAQYVLGLQLSKSSRGLAQDCAQAVRFLSMASKQGNGDAEFELGECYARGLGVKKSWKRAAECYMRAGMMRSKYSYCPRSRLYEMRQGWHGEQAQEACSRVPETFISSEEDYENPGSLYPEEEEPEGAASAAAALAAAASRAAAASAVGLSGGGSAAAQ